MRALNIFTCLVLYSASLTTNAAVLLKDTFESGSLNSPTSGGSWGSATNVTNSANGGYNSQHAAKFNFIGNTSTASNADAFSELRFDLGKLSSTVWVQFQLYIPSNYVHRNAESTDNNKFIRLWGSDYNNVEKVGLSTWPTSNGGSKLIADWNNGGGIGPKGSQHSDFITSSDLGKWMTIKIQFVAATSTQPGTLNLWKNGVKVIDNTGTVDSYRSGEPHAYRYGYLLGWSNSGFTQTTSILIDDVTFATSEAELGDAPNPPNPPSFIQVQ